MYLVFLACACGGRASGPATPAHDLDLTRQDHAAAPSAAGSGSAAAPPPVTPAPTAITTAPPPAPPPAPAVPDATTIARLGWPAATTSFVLHNAAHVYAAPDLTAEPLGKIAFNTRLPVGESATGDKHCKFWLAAVPRGWICARDARPSTLPPEAMLQPVVPDGRLVPQDYYGLVKGAKRYATEDDVRAGIARPEPKAVSTYMVTKGKVVEIDGETYVHTGVGLVALSDLYRHSPSPFAGLDLVKAPPASWPFAWVIAANGRTVTARATPSKKGAAAGTRAHRELVPVLEEADGFVRVAEGVWLERASVRIARKRPRPAVDGADAKWIDLDRDEQVMVAYEGETPIYATLFSSGRRKQDTPPALYRIRSKSAVTKMAAEERENSHYEISEVPWATRFRSGLYFHAAYWHDQFGTPKSHGCVNLSPHDARWVYDWTAPAMPPGWNELEVAMPGSVVVLVHDAEHPDPPAFDYDREAIERVKIRKRERELKRQREAAEAAAAGTAPATP